MPFLLGKMQRRHSGVLASAVLELFCVLLSLLAVFPAEGIKHKTKDAHLASSFTSLSAGVHLTSGTNSTGNPFLDPPYADFFARFNIPQSHGSGIYVDLSNDKDVDGKTYREAAGLCPVFGKNIILYQPLKAGYANDFLANIPTAQESQAVGNPLPGGFNNNYKLTNGTSYSPMSDAQLNSYITAKTALGKCAEMSYLTTVPNSSGYRYPFVYDTKNGVCYFLFITMQRLMGERYCSTRNEPPGLTWYCFEPKKSANVRPELVYGSSYVGKDPDAWQEKCPNKAVSGSVFGVWSNGVCVEHRHRSASKVERVASKEECWALAFNNPEVASDHPSTTSEDIGTLGYYFPSAGPDQPKSGGKGMNYASYYGGSLGECVLSAEIPDCAVPLASGVAYTALGSLEEEALPNCDSSFPQTPGSCDFKSCKRTISTCEGNHLVANEAGCSTGDTLKCESVVLIICLSVGGVLLVVLAASVFFYRRRQRKPPITKSASAQSEYLQEQAVAPRKPKRQSDLVQQAEPSFWEEADVNPDDGEDTEVVVDRDY
ncbi:apical membrane antigen-1 AMA1 [Cyclospora cayetanensis]|uniref:Apical membrane antigen-1 AMA1 n=1 Tax=Cyclospora cayetanensis TaxID=88456 RepID=A0A1D3D729_9EIME|nr:apical membrane antigen-1 AMA1 [Cyclospora cayetanensis]